MSVDVAEWLASLRRDARLSAKTGAVLDVVARQPRTTSYGTTGEVARRAGVNNATVVRAAQALGFDGWPSFQRELRSRYLASLTAVEVGAQRTDGSRHPAIGAVRRDLDNIGLLTRTLDVAAVDRFADALARSRRTVVVAAGSYDAVGLVLAHLATVMGYPVDLEPRGGSHLANALSRLDGDCCLVAIGFWRLHAELLDAARIVSGNGGTVCAITDSTTNALSGLADHTLVVSSESDGWFPSLAAAVVAVNAVLVTLEHRPGTDTRGSIERLERIWHRLDLYE